MKKKVLCMMVLACFMLLMAGCGEKDKFASAQADVMKLTKQADEINTPNRKLHYDADGKRSKEDIETVTQDIKEAEDEHQKVMDEIDGKLKEMEGYANKEATLKPQLEHIRQQVTEKDKEWKQGISEQKAILKMSAESGGKQKIYDPYVANHALKWSK